MTRLAMTFRSLLPLVALALASACPDCGTTPVDDQDSGLHPVDAGSVDVVVGEPDPNNNGNDQLDSDCDGLSDAEEYGTVWPSGQTTDPGATDSDGDGIRDGVEAGRTSSVDPRCDGLFQGDSDPSTHTDPTNPDTDGDGLLDGQEDANLNGRYDRMVESDPKNPDSDGDGICDGPNAVPPACTAGPDPTPIPTNTDADGDGLPDALDAEPNNPDRDGDGLCDGPNDVSGVCVGGEDRNADGILDPGESDPNLIDSDHDGLVDGFGYSGHSGERDHGTDPSNFDSDGDGLSDGLEVGVTVAPDPASTSFTADADPATTTDPLDPDSDGDGLPDGVEDSNQNGRVDDGEFDPNNPADGGSDPTVQAACRTDRLIPVDQHREWMPDLQVATAIRTPDAFSEKARIANPVAGETMTIVGIMGFNPQAGIAYLVFFKDTTGADASAEESYGRGRIAAAGALGAPVTTPLTTWDGYPAVRASYDQAGSRGVKAQANQIVRQFYPQASELLDENNDVTPSGGYKLQAEFVRRSDETSVVLVALMPADRYSGRAVFTLDDTANGTALAQYPDSIGTQCDRFKSTGFADVDFLWAVDNSGSMGDDQAAVAAAGQEMGSILTSSTMNWRLALVTSEFYLSTSAACTSSSSSPCRNFTTDISEFTGWFTEGSPSWVTDNGSGSERTMESAQLFISGRLLPSSTADPPPADKLRRGAHLVVVFMTDAEDQASGYNTVSGRQANIASYTSFFSDWDPDLPGAQPILAGGILCPPGVASQGSIECDPTEPYADSPVVHTVVTNLGGAIGTLLDPTTIRPTILQILANAAGAISPYVLTKPAISSTIKVAMEQNSTVGACNWDDVPRDRQNGFDYDPFSRTIVFYGDCRPDPNRIDTRVAVSYRYWIDQSHDPDPQEGPCGICPTCPGIARCDIETCVCICEQTITCAPGYAWDQVACDCVCDVAALNCSETREADPVLCACVCKPDCGGCPGDYVCQPSICECIPLGG
ncbi:MAG: hypothetical protein JXR83_21225 [Deltaproteobacteria bacterium]|nr:hypothetical protein [Deltaproteobacteria bacterium]